MRPRRFGVVDAVMGTGRVPVAARGLEGRCVALAGRVDVDRVRARRQPGRGERDVERAIGLGDGGATGILAVGGLERGDRGAAGRSEEHTSELQSLMRNSYAVFCLKKTTI